MIEETDLETFLTLCKVFEIDQLSFRAVVKPNHTAPNNASKWIDENAKPEFVDNYVRNIMSDMKEKGRFLRNLPYGAKLYDCDGISTTYFEYCIQDNSGENDIRSLIFQENGNLYTTWNSEASKLF